MKLSWVIEDFWRGIPTLGRAFLGGVSGGLVGGLVGSILSPTVGVVLMLVGALALIFVVVRDAVRNG